MTYEELMKTGWAQPAPTSPIKERPMDEPSRLYLVGIADELRERLLLAQTRILQLEREIIALRKAAGKPSPSEIGNAVKAKQKSAKAMVSRTYKEVVFETFGGVCFYCQIPLEFFKSTLDHQIPRSKHGSNHLSNLVCSCAPCNTAKGSRMPTQEELERAAFIRSEHALAKDLTPAQNVVSIRDPWISQMEAKIEAAMKPRSNAEPQLG